MKILVVRLQSDCSRPARVGHEFYKVINEAEEEYTVDLALCDIFINNKKFIPKISTNKVRYTEAFARIDDQDYWFIDSYVYATIQNEIESKGIVDYWTDQVVRFAKDRVKERNKILKELYKSIETL